MVSSLQATVGHHVIQLDGTPGPVALVGLEGGYTASNKATLSIRTSTVAPLTLVCPADRPPLGTGWRRPWWGGPGRVAVRS